MKDVDTHPWYVPERDGALDVYIRDRDHGITTQPHPLFKGYKYFGRLWLDGYFEPNVSYIRLMWNIGRGDEHFGVTEARTLVGLDGGFHSGRPGTHDPRKILRNAPCWEARMLNMEPKPRRPNK